MQFTSIAACVRYASGHVMSAGHEAISKVPLGYGVLLASNPARLRSC
jgi:hypothetical protein